MTARRQRSTEVRIYKYGVLAPSSDARSHLDEELFRANQYHNELIAIERTRRERFAAVRAEAVPELQGVEGRLMAIESELDVTFEAHRGGDDAASGRLAALKEERATLTARAKQLRDEFKALLAPGQQAFDERTSGAPAALLRELDRAGRALKEAKKIRRNPEVPILRRRLDELKRQRRSYLPSPHRKAEANETGLNQMMDEDWPDAWKRVARADAEAVVAIKKARAQKSVGAPTSRLIERAVEAVRRDSKMEPRFRRFRGEGQIGGQVPDADGTTKIFSAKNGLIRIGEKVSGSGRFAKRAVELRVGEWWIALSARWHRELPADARITWAWLKVRRDGWTKRYELQLTVESERHSTSRREVAQDGKVRVRLGWASIDDAPQVLRPGESPPDARYRPLIVATAEDERGTVTECVLPRSEIERLNHREANLRRISDLHYNETHKIFQSVVRRWLERHPESVPTWITERPVVRGEARRSMVDTMHLWRSHEALARASFRWCREVLGEERVNDLWLRWRDERKARGLDLFGRIGEFTRWARATGVVDSRELLVLYFEWWRRKELHLADWGTRQTRGAERARAQRYRLWGIDLSKLYATLTLEDIDLSRTAQDHGARDRAPNPVDSRVRSQQRDAAPSVMRAALLEVFGKDRTTILKRERSGGEDRPGTARRAEKKPGHERRESIDDRAAE